MMLTIASLLLLSVCSVSSSGTSGMKWHEWHVCHQLARQLCHQEAYQLCHQGQVQDFTEQDFLEAIVHWLHVRLAQLCRENDNTIVTAVTIAHA